MAPALSLEGKVVVVIGGGVAPDAARLFVQHGATVVVCSPDVARVTDITGGGPGRVALFRPDGEDTAVVLEFAREQFGGVDLVVDAAPATR